MAVQHSLDRFLAKVRGLRARRLRDSVSSKGSLLMERTSSISRLSGARLVLEGELLVSKGSQILMDQDAELRTRGNVILGSGVLIWIGKGAYVELENGVSLGANCKIYSNRGVHIRKACILETQVSLSDSDFHPVVPLNSKEPDPRETPAKEIHLGAGVRLGAGAIILKGVRLAAHSEVAAGTVVKG